MITITLLGALGDKFGREWQLDIATPAEAIRAIAYQVPEFAPYLNTNNHYQVIIDGESVDAEGLDYQIQRDLVIAPVMVASGAVGKIVTGAVLLGTSFFMPASFLGISSLMVGQMGVSMLAGGIVDLLSPQPAEDKRNANLTAQAEAVQGRPVPVLFGSRFIQPPVISSWLDNIDER